MSAPVFVRPKLSALSAQGDSSESSDPAVPRALESQSSPIHSFLLRRQTSEAGSVERKAAASQALEAMYVVAQEQLLKRAEESRGWLHFGSKVDQEQEKGRIDALFAKAKVALESGRIASPLRILEGLNLSEAERSLLGQIKTEPLLRELDSLGQESDPSLRNQGLLLFARERLLKTEALPQSAIFLAQSLQKESATAQGAGEVLAMVQGTGGLGVKLDYLFPHLAKEISKPSMLAAMMAAPLAGAAFEMGGLRVASTALGGRQLGMSARLGASVLGMGGEALAFTGVHKTVDSAFDDPGKVWAHTGNEILSTMLLFGAMRIAHGASAWTTARMAEGQLNFAGFPMLGGRVGIAESLNVAVTPTGRILSDTLAAGAGMPTLTAGGKLLKEVLDHGGGILAMQASGALSRRVGLAPDKGQGFGGNFVDAAIQYTQALAGGHLANVATGGSLQARLAEMKFQTARLAEYRVRSSDPAEHPLPVLRHPAFASVSGLLAGLGVLFRGDLAWAQPAVEAAKPHDMNAQIMTWLSTAAVGGLIAWGIKKFKDAHYAPKRWIRDVEALRAKLPEADPAVLKQQLAKVDEYLTKTRSCQRVGDQSTAEASLHFMAEAIPRLQPKDRLTALLMVEDALRDGGEPIAYLALRILKNNADHLEPEHRAALATNLRKGLRYKDPDKFLNAVLGLATLMSKLDPDTHLDVAELTQGALELRQADWDGYLQLAWLERVLLHELREFMDQRLGEKREKIEERISDMVEKIKSSTGLSRMVWESGKTTYQDSLKKLKDDPDEDILIAFYRELRRQGVPARGLEEIFAFAMKMREFFGENPEVSAAKPEAPQSLRDRLKEFQWYAKEGGYWIRQLQSATLIEGLADLQNVHNRDTIVP